MKRMLTPAEHALWRRAMQGVSPLGRKPAPLMGAGEERSEAKRGAALAPQGTSAGLAKRSPSKASAPLADPFGAGDPREDRRVAGGRAPIEATLDLHGLNQGAARSALLRFLTKARAEGRRCVLVITGKGERAASSGRESGGVLRARFRDWLREDAFRPHVARAAQARARHGGDGAFYVFLKAPASGRRKI